MSAREAAYAALAIRRPRPEVPAAAVEHFLTRLRAQGGQCTRVKNDSEARAYITGLLAEKDEAALVTPDVWIEAMFSGPGPNLSRCAPDAPGSMAGLAITTALAAVAETGSLLLHPRPGAPMTMNFLCDRLVVLVHAADVLANLEDLWARTREVFGNDTPRALCLVSGPSSSGDIGMQFATGVHGPIELHAIVVEG